MSNAPLPVVNTSLLMPPYDKLVAPQHVEYCPNRGVAAVWFVRESATQLAEREWLADRPSGVELIVVLPPAAQIRSALPLLRDLNDLRPRGILPHGQIGSAEPIRLLLANGPRDLAGAIVAHLTRESILRNQRIRGIVSKVFELAPTVPSVSTLARKLYTSRRTLGRHFEAEGLPVPSHWLQFARLMYVSVMIQEKRDMPIFKAAIHVGYPDGFTMSNQMKRLIGCRPSDVRDNLGYEWIIEEWVRRERQAGRLSGPWYPPHVDVAGWLRRNPTRNETSHGD